MNKEDRELPGVRVIQGLVFQDDRGHLKKPFSTHFFSEEEQGAMNLHFKEIWFTFSKLNVLRGMHMQIGAAGCAKYVSVLQGSVTDVLLDLRAESPSFGNYMSLDLDGGNATAIYIPEGIAHGYVVRSPSAIVMYAAAAAHDAKSDVGVRWDSFDFDWGCSDPIVSERDTELPTVEAFIQGASR